MQGPFLETSFPVVLKLSKGCAVNSLDNMTTVGGMARTWILLRDFLCHYFSYWEGKATPLKFSYHLSANWSSSSAIVVTMNIH